MRTRFDEQLRQLNVELIRMGSLCEEAISIAAKFLEGDKKAPVDKVFALEHEMDQLEHDIETRCMRMLLQQQPVARDLLCRRYYCTGKTAYHQNGKSRCYDGKRKCRSFCSGRS